MIVKSFLVQGTTGANIATRLAQFIGRDPLDALLLFSLGVDHTSLIQNTVLPFIVQQQSDDGCRVYLTETYGIIGYDEDLGRNVELMEQGRGSEYGNAGGSGGQGCLAVGFRGDHVRCGHGDPNDSFPDSTQSTLLIADQSGTYSKDMQSKALPHCLYYGGITKECFRIDKNGQKHSVPYFWIADGDDGPIGVTTFADESESAATSAARSLLHKLPSTTLTVSGHVGLFPCFTRGVNLYGSEDVESQQVSQVIPNCRTYGMFAHGELGPITGYCDYNAKAACTQHSMTTIMSIHTIPLN
jgi:hypothetical protein